MFVTIDDIDWQVWQPRQRATLMLVISNGKILLMRKKRGLGAGKITGPGGRIEQGETPQACAEREIQEELGIEVLDARHVGELLFQFTDGFSMHVALFRASEYRGTPGESDEGIPHWFLLDEVPYREMWEDDILWLPRLFEGQSISGHFLFADDKLLSGRVVPFVGPLA